MLQKKCDNMETNSQISIVVSNSTPHLVRKEEVLYFNLRFLSLLRKNGFHDYLLFYKNRKVFLIEPNLELWYKDKKLTVTIGQ